MNRIIRRSSLLVVLFFLTFTLRAQPVATTRPVVRVAMIGGVNDSGLWKALSERFEHDTGIRVDTEAYGPKDAIVPIFKEGDVDVVTMHVSDAMADLLADGYVDDAQPFARNDMVLIGPADDPAGAKGSPDVATALGKIIKAKCRFVVHHGIGAQTTLRSVMSDHDLEFDPSLTTVLLEDRQRAVLKIAAEQKAYTLIGRIAFLDGKIPNAGMVAIVQGERDPKLRRTYLIGTSNPRRFPGAHAAEARKLVAFLRSPETQAFIGGFGKGKFDAFPLFFPVTVPGDEASATRPAGALLAVGGEGLSKPLSLDAAGWAKLERHAFTARDKNGKDVRFEGVAVKDLLKAAGLTLGGHRPAVGGAGFCVVVEAADGYTAVLSMPEVADDDPGHTIYVADRRDGQALDAKEGSLRLIVPADPLPSRWVRSVVAIRLAKP